LTDPMDLNGKLLVAMPGMGDPRFAHSVVQMCAYSAEGAMGLIINKVSGDLRLRDLMEQLSIPTHPDMKERLIHFGGPVESGRGFVLHERGYNSSISTMEIGEDFAMTATLDILEDLGEGRGPARAIVALGYAGWGPGQLETEIAQNGWLTCDATVELVFETAHRRKWDCALKSLGIDALTLSSDAGRA